MTEKLCTGITDMQVTELKELTKSRVMIKTDQEEVFVLYKKELKEYDISQNGEISEDHYRKIMTELLPRRAKLRSMNLLKAHDYTEKEIRDRLERGFYPQSVIEEAVSYIKSYRYIDDYRYARAYIGFQSENKSRKQIENELCRRGISKTDLEHAYTDAVEEDRLPKEEDLMEKFLRKKKYDKDAASFEEKQKMSAFLFRKGFSSEKIRKILQNDLE